MSSWTIVDRARNVAEATLLQRALQAHGITAQVSGEHRAAIAGELPLNEAQLELRVPEHEAARAKQVLDALRTADTGAPWRCAECGEENPGSFDECWKCARGAEAGERLAELPPAEGPSGLPPLVVFALGLIALGLVAFFSFRQGQQAMPGSALTYLKWADAHCLEERARTTHRVVTRWCDRQRDEIFEQVSSFSRAGQKVSEQVDRDQDGVYEVLQVLDATGRVTVEYLDDDQDGRHDRRVEHGTAGDVVWYDDDHDGLFERREPPREH